MDLRIQCLCVDARDPSSIASFWEAALGWRRTSEDPDEVVLEPPSASAEDGVVPDLLFLRVPESKTLKNRLHLDLRPVDQQAEVARLVFSRKLDARRLITHQFPLAQTAAAIALASHPTAESLKVVVVQGE